VGRAFAERGMIRANLLPASRDALVLFGANLDRRLVRDAAGGLVLLCLVSAGTYGVQEVRLTSLRRDAERLEQSVAANSMQRREVAATAAVVARLEQLRRETEVRRRSGNEVAATLIAIGNAVPLRVWLDGIDRTANGFVVTGAATSLDDVGQTLVAVERSMPGYAPSLAGVSREENGSVLHFSLQLQSASASPPARAPQR
jgi:Tfp pilus assembly protein PilN